VSLSNAGRGEGCLRERYSREARAESAATTEPIPHFQTPTSPSARTPLRTVRETIAAALARISQHAPATSLFGTVGWVAKPSTPVRWRRWVSCIYSGYALLGCVTFSPFALASGGVCKWEGGPGVSLPPSPTLTGYASFCAMEDCVGAGGYAKCTKPKKAPANSRTDAESDQEKWSYQMCDWAGLTSGNVCSQSASWCQAAGGTVFGTNSCGCSGLPSWVIKDNPTFSRAESPVIPTSNAYAPLRLGSNLCSPIVSTDTGWAGITNTDDLVCGGALAQKNGINILEPRRVRYSTTAGPNCTPSSVQLTLTRQRSLACDFGYLARQLPNGDMQCYKPVENVCPTSHPVVPTYGAKQHEQTDFSGGNGLHFVWRYRSDGYYRDKSEPIGSVSPRDVWRHNWQRDLWSQPAGSGLLAILRIGGGEVLYFDDQGNAVLNLNSPRFNGHFYDVDKGVRDEQREEKV
jgi:hypothetical protein